MARIYAITSGNLGNHKNTFKGFTCQGVASERQRHLSLSKKRDQIFKDILSNNSSESTSLKFIFYGLAGIIALFLSTCSITLIPVHNVIENPEYWYEFLLSIGFPFLPIWAVSYMLRCSVYMSANIIKSQRNFRILWLAISATCFGWQCVGYNIWTEWFHYRYPIPWNAKALGCITTIVMLTSLWYLFPIKCRKEKGFRKRFNYFILTMVTGHCIFYEYGILIKLLLLVPTNYQWIVAFFPPLVREFNSWAVTTMACKATHGDITAANIAVNQAIGTQHSLFLAICVGSIATNATCAITIGIDFLINLWICTKIIRARRKGSIPTEKEIELLQSLVINEMIEVVVPLAYLLCLVAAYYGPNSELIGNVGNSYWQYSAIEDIERTIKYILAFFVIDLGSLVVTSITLWSSYQINLYKAYVVLQKEFGFLFWFSMAAQMYAVSIHIYNVNLCT